MPKTRSQGAASPAHELQLAPPRTRARKPKTFEPKTALSPVTSSSPNTQGETATPVVASSPITKPSTVLSPTASPLITKAFKASKASKASAAKVPYRQLLHSKGLKSAGLTHSRLLRPGKKNRESIRDKSPSSELEDPPCGVHGHRNSFDLKDVPLVAPTIFYVKTNYKDAPTQSSKDEQNESGLTELPAQTPVKRTREESAGEAEEQRASKRHQSNLTESSTHTSTETSTKASTQTSTQTDSSTTTGDQSRSTSAPTTPKRTKMASITQAKSRAKASRSSPITRSQVKSSQLTSDMTWGQMNRVKSRRSQLLAKQMQGSQDEEPIHEQSPQPSQSAPDNAPTTPQTAPQPRTGFFGSIRKSFNFFPQLPAVTKMLTNSFSPLRSTPAVGSDQTDSSSPRERANSVEVNPVRNTPESISMLDAQAGADVDMNDSTASSLPQADASTATEPSQKRKREGLGVYYDDPNYIDSDEEDGSDNESSAPVAKKQKLDETQTPRSVLRKRTGTGTVTLPRTNKRVTFDDSPVDTPSKIRTRSFEYTGIHFADAPSHSHTSPSLDDETSLSNSPGTKANTEANTPFYYERPIYPPLPAEYVLPADFTPTSAHPRPGTFCLDFNTYDENDDNIDWDAPVESIHSNMVVGDPGAPAALQTSPPTVEELAATPTMALPPATPRIAHADLPATTVAPSGITIHADDNAGPTSTTTTAETNVLADVTQEQINKVRSTAEQHKSKNPSRLSQVERATSMSPPAEGEYNEFDAGWPEPKSYVEAGVCSQRIFDMVDKTWDPRDNIIGEMVYEQDLKEWTDAHRLEKEQGVPVRYHWGDEEKEER